MQTVLGSIMLLAKKLGEGRTAQAYLLLKPIGKSEPLVIKFIEPKNSLATPQEIARDIVAGDKLLRQAQTIPYLKIEYANTDRVLPYIIQELLPEGAFTFNVDNAGDLTLKVRNRNLPLGKTLPKPIRTAVLKLYKDLASKGLVWEDGHLENIYFFKEKGIITAGILDSDRIIKYKDLPKASKRMKTLFTNVMETPNVLGNEIKSMPRYMDEGYRFSNAREFMIKMLEYRGRYIRYNPSTGEFERILMPIVEVKEVFPDLEEFVVVK